MDLKYPYGLYPVSYTHLDVYKRQVLSGTAKVFWISGADEAVTLLETTGTYSDTITLPDGGNYIGIESVSYTHLNYF